MSRKNTRHARTLAHRRYEHRSQQKPPARQTIADLLRDYAWLTDRSSGDASNGFWCQMPSGCVLTIWDRPAKFIEGSTTGIYFGDIYYPERKHPFNLRYLDQRAADYLYNKLKEAVAEARRQTPSE